MVMRGRIGRAVVAAAAIAVFSSAPPAHAGLAIKHYVAAGGGPVFETTPLASCTNDDGALPSVGGSCFTITGPTVVHITVQDDVSPLVGAYYDVDLANPNGFFCGGADIVVSPGEHFVGVWVGGVNIVQAPCFPGQATTGTVTMSN